MNVPKWDNCTEEDFWQYVAWHLSAGGVETVLVGGAVVAIYSSGIHRSGDIDLVPDEFQRTKIAGILQEIGFVKSGKHFNHPECHHIFVDFPMGPVSLGDDYNLKPDKRVVEGKVLKLLSPTDCVKDRLASYIYFSAHECFDQAVLVAKSQNVRLNNIKAWCAKEGTSDIYKEFKKAIDQH